MRRYGGIKILAVLLVIILAIVASISPIMNNLNLGLDLRGGVHVVVQAVPDNGGTITSEDMDKLTSVMRNRVDEFGVSEPLIQREGSDRLIIELAGVNDPDQAVEMLGKTAKLEFLDPSGNVILDGADLKDAAAGQSQNGVGGEVYLTFTSEGAKAFADATAKFVGQTINIELDGEIIQSATVQEVIPNGEARISNMESYDEAANTAALLRGGSLPVNIDILEKRGVGASLGADSLSKSYQALLYGILAVFIFMILYYRLPGFYSIISLLLYGLIVLWMLVAINATITLPGIAGFLLSMGMAVDANVIIFERLKDELRKGKSLSASIDSGFKRAFKAILDANVTTLIATVVLFYFGTGSVKGFAITLSIGVLASMFTAIVFTRFLLKLGLAEPGLCKKSLYRG